MRTNQFLSSFSCFLSRLVFPQMIHILHAESFVQQVKRVSFPPWHRKWSWANEPFSPSLRRVAWEDRWQVSNGTMLKQIDRAMTFWPCAKPRWRNRTSSPKVTWVLKRQGMLDCNQNENITKALDVKKPPIHERILLIGTGKLACRNYVETWIF